MFTVSASCQTQRRRIRSFWRNYSSNTKNPSDARGLNRRRLFRDESAGLRRPARRQLVGAAERRRADALPCRRFCFNHTATVFGLHSCSTLLWSPCSAVPQRAPLSGRSSWGWKHFPPQPLSSRGERHLLNSFFVWQVTCLEVCGDLLFVGFRDG